MSSLERTVPKVLAARFELLGITFGMVSPKCDIVKLYRK